MLFSTLKIPQWGNFSSYIHVFFQFRKESLNRVPLSQVVTGSSDVSAGMTDLLGETLEPAVHLGRDVSPNPRAAEGRGVPSWLLEDQTSRRTVGVL